MLRHDGLNGMFGMIIFNPELVVYKYFMIIKQPWYCPDGLLDQALLAYPITEEVTVLNDPSGDFFYDTWTIKNCYKDTLWEQVLNTLPVAIGQARIISLKPGESYMAHADIDNRWHLNLTSQESYLIDLENKVMHECRRDDRWAYMDAGRIHAATNYGSVPRLQLVVRELLVKNNNPKNLVAITIEPSYDQHDFRYKFDNIFSTFLNRKNQSYKLADFMHSKNTVSFKLEQECLEDFKQLISPEFKITYE